MHRDGVCLPLFIFSRRCDNLCPGYRSQRAGAAGGGVYAFSEGLAEAQRRQSENAARQANAKQEYEQRVRDFGTHLYTPI